MPNVIAGLELRRESFNRAAFRVTWGRISNRCDSNEAMEMAKIAECLIVVVPIAIRRAVG
jgi:hypothetical protein